MTWTFLTVLLAVAATYRLTVLISSDNITRPLRNRLFARWPQAREFVDCYWCVSIWCAAFVVVGAELVHWWTPAAVLLSASAITGLVGPKH